MRTAVHLSFDKRSPYERGASHKNEDRNRTLGLPKVAGKEASQVLTDKLLSKDCERALGGMASKDQTYAKSQEGITVSLERIERQKIQINTIIESSKQQGIMKDNGFGIKL